MRRVWKYPLRFHLREGNPFVIDRIEFMVPRGGQVVRFADSSYQAEPGPDPVPTLWALVDDEAKPEPRRFQVFGTGAPVPSGAQYVGSYETGPFVWHVFELIDADLPADLPPEMHGHYRLLLRDGFKATGPFETPGFPPRHSWAAPDDIPPGQLSTEQLIAVASLQEHGYGPVVNA